MVTYSVNIDYPGEIMEVEANSKEEAEEKALEELGEVTICCLKECTAEAFELKGGFDEKWKEKQMLKQ